MNLRIGLGPLWIRVPVWLVLLALAGGTGAGYIAGKAWLLKEIGL